MAGHCYSSYARKKPMPSLELGKSKELRLFLHTDCRAQGMARC